METPLRYLPGRIKKDTVFRIARMDKNCTHNILPGCGFESSKTAVDKPFNGWFLMKTPQVSTGGVSYLYCKTGSSKKQLSCGKIAVQFFSLQAYYPVDEFDFYSQTLKINVYEKYTYPCRERHTLFIINQTKDSYENGTIINVTPSTDQEGEILKNTYLQILRVKAGTSL